MEGGRKEGRKDRWIGEVYKDSATLTKKETDTIRFNVCLTCCSFVGHLLSDIEKYKG